MRDFVQEKIDNILYKKNKIELLCILCPLCRTPYYYLDELDMWLVDNGFDTAKMWGIYDI